MLIGFGLEKVINDFMGDVSQEEHKGIRNQVTLELGMRGQE